MKDPWGTNQELIEEISALQQRIKELEHSESQRKRAEEALESERTLLRNLIDNVPDRIYAKDSEGRFIICNEAMIRRMGMTSMTELVGKSDFDLLPLEMAQRFHADEQAIIQSGIPMINREEPLTTEGGTITRWNLATKVPLLDKQGNRIGIVGVGREITDRKQAEEALKERNKELNCLYGISAILELPGISLDEILKRTVMLIPPAWQFPEITEASIELEGKIFQTARFRETSWMQTSEVIVNGMPVGQVEVCYLEERQASDEGPFLKEERKLLNAIAERLGRITERKRAEEALRESEEKYRLVVENAAESILIAQDGLLKYVNPMTVKLLGYSEEVLTSMPFVKLIHPEDKEKLFEAHIRTMRGEENQPVHQFRVVTLDGTIRWADSRAVVISWEGKPATLNFLTDITERKRMEEALRESEKRYRELSIVDDLTQLYNSRHFYFQLKIELDRSNRYEQPLTLLLLDLDNFKAFNDAYGHVEGDQVLLRLGQVVKRCLRETDFAYRYGGEEFTILLPMTTSADGAVTAERIRTEFKKETFSPAPGQDVHVTVSIGLAQYKPQEEMKAFVHRVDQLMYQGKKNGKDRVCSES